MARRSRIAATVTARWRWVVSSAATLMWWRRSGRATGARLLATGPRAFEASSAAVDPLRYFPERRRLRRAVEACTGMTDLISELRDRGFVALVSDEGGLRRALERP